MTLNTSFFYFLFSPTKNRGDFTGKFPCQIWGHKKYKKRWHLKMTLKKIFLFYVLSFFTHCTTLFLFTAQNTFYNTENTTKQKLFWIFFKIFYKISYHFLIFHSKNHFHQPKIFQNHLQPEIFLPKNIFSNQFELCFSSYLPFDFWKRKMNRFIPKSSTKINSESIYFKWQTNLFLIYQVISTPNQTKTNPTRITNQFILDLSTNFYPISISSLTNFNPNKSIQTNLFKQLQPFCLVISSNFQPTKIHHKLNNNFCRFFAPKSFKPDKNYNS